MKLSAWTAPLLRQMAAATRHGLALHEVASILSEDARSPTEAKVLAQFTTALRDGKSLADAMAHAPDVFSAETVAWIRAAQDRDLLAATLDALADDFERDAHGTTAVKLVMAWPVCLAVVIVILFVVTSIFVMPAFREIYDTFNVELPPLTRLTFGAGQLLVNAWWLWFALIALWALLHFTNRMPTAFVGGIRGALNRVWFIRRYRVATFTSRLVALLRVHDGESQLQAAALAHLAAGTRSVGLSSTARRLHDALSRGTPLSQALAAESALPRHLFLYARLGERMNDLSAPLAQLGSAADAELSEALRYFERDILLGLYLVFGTAAGTLVIAVYLPIFKLGAMV